MFKKFLAIIVTVTMSLSLVACAEDSSSSKKDSSVADSSVVDSSVADSSVVDSSEPDSSVVDSSQPDSSVVDSSEPDSSEPDSSEPDSSSGSFGPPVAEESAITPPMWKVTSDNGAVIYFLGSMHALSKECYPFPDEILEAFDSSDSLAVEIDIITYSSDMQAQMNTVAKMMYTDGTTIVDHIDAELYESAKAILEEKGLYSNLYDVYNPLMWSSFIELAMMQDAGLDSEYGIDNQLLKKAHKENKPIIELETPQLQEDILYGQPEEFNIYMLESSVYYYEDQVELLKDMYDAWKLGDLDALMAEEEVEPEEGAEEEEISEELLQIIEEYNYQLMDERNAGMIAKAIEMLENGDKVFYVVGAAHYHGETGIIKGLEDAGYTVEPVVFD